MRELIQEKKSGIALYGNDRDGYVITDDGSGVCNSIEEMSAYFETDTDSAEIDLVNKILEKGNKVLFADHGDSYGKGEYTYEEYLRQFDGDDFIIFPYVTFDSIDKATEIFDLLH